MSVTKKILKKYFENLYSGELHASLVSWLTRNRYDPEVEKTLEEMWNDVDIQADGTTRNELREVKGKLGILHQSGKTLRRPGIGRTAVYISAACVAVLLVVSTLLLMPERGRLDRQEIFAQLSELDIDSVSATTIVAGDIVMTLQDNDSVWQTEGGIIVNGQRELRFDDAGSGVVQIMVPKGKRSRVRLCDGTDVWINSGTKLIWPEKFGGRSRDIYVDGELYLDVATTGRPFVVNTAEANVRVLGTQFNVRFYSEEREHSVVLVEGKVEVETTDKKSKETLQPGQAVFYCSNMMLKREVDADKYIYWKSGVLKLEGESLKGIFGKLSRYYNVTIEYDDRNDCRQYKGKLILGDSVEEVLQNIAAKEGFSFTRENGSISVHKK